MLWMAVVVELFTSQGCSSCPPAETLLTELGRQPNVIALAFHVDYWDKLGWRDPFSSKAWTARQAMYAETLGHELYTPQLVVNGRVDVVGSHGARVRAALDQAEPVASLEATAAMEGDRVVVKSGARGELVAVLYENGLTTTIARGENAGETQRNDFVARALVPLHGGTAVIPLDSSWKKIGVVVLSQDPRTNRILAAVQLPLR
jgi:hypothetical protein